MVHIRFEGRSYDLDARRVAPGRTLAELTDGEVKRHLAAYLDVSPERLRFYVVDRPETGRLVVRPEAVYG